jgi:hypothetical protein
MAGYLWWGVTASILAAILVRRNISLLKISGWPVFVQKTSLRISGLAAKAVFAAMR